MIKWRRVVDCGTSAAGRSCAATSFRLSRMVDIGSIRRWNATAWPTEMVDKLECGVQKDIPRYSKTNIRNLLK